jgi:hypothetical protein
MSSVMPHRSIAGPVPRQHHALGVSFNHLQLSRAILPIPVSTVSIPFTSGRWFIGWKCYSTVFIPSIMDAFVSLSEAGTEEVTRPIDRDRAKTVA